ncbi:PREDICTED: uncharacterized protein LOC104813725 isoform X2 [Tarenaya hassleriana]|uniref:uncharacterized protein LOC104813725 isoform X2 n=1 Tax=Tarenaya hassleriana TaxID=28532 RepID=UPI00053C0E56|nr:PREDICTED: uncharacterized protein LOC104813725 isoform X2 [Tarenaya hassleriana]
MASFGFDTLPPCITFGDLRIGRPMQRIIGRLLRFWEARNVKKGDELMSVDFLLIDEKSTVAQGSIGRHLLSRYKDVLREGAIYLLTDFAVVRANDLFKLTDFKLSIRFTERTNISEVGVTTIEIPKEFFRFRAYDELIALANKNEELPDVIGRVQRIRDTNNDHLLSKQRVVVDLQMASYQDIRMTAWETKADEFRLKLENTAKQPRVILVTNINPKFVGGILYLNTTSASKFYFDDEADASKTFISMFKDNIDEALQIEQPVHTVMKMETVSISELCDFITLSKSQEAEFLCKATIIEVSLKNGWTYVACGKCSRKLAKVSTSMVCNYCHDTNAVGVLRFRVELVVQDGKDVAFFTVFDREMTKLLNIRASESIEPNVLNVDVEGKIGDIPKCFTPIIDNIPKDTDVTKDNTNEVSHELAQAQNVKRLGKKPRHK